MLGKALIIQENATGCGTGVCSDPDDEAGGGVIEMVLASSAFSVGLDVIDIDTNEASGGLTFWDDGTSVFLSFGSLIQASDLGNNSANRIAPISIQNAALAAAGFTGIDEVEVRFIHSGAIDNVTVPEPLEAEDGSRSRRPRPAPPRRRPVHPHSRPERVRSRDRARCVGCRVRPRGGS